MKSCQNPIIVTQTCTKAINLHNEITTKYLIAIQSTIQQFQTGELIIDESRGICEKFGAQIMSK